MFKALLENVEAYVRRIALDVFHDQRDYDADWGPYGYWHHHPVVPVQLDEGAHLPVRFYPTDAGADICCIEEFTVPAHSSRVIDTGVHVELPKNTVLMVKAKSGLNIKARLLTDGTVDEGYTGQIKVCVYNHGEYPYTFEAGKPVTQIVLMPVLYPTYLQVDEVKGGDRGSNGFGSTSK